MKRAIFLLIIGSLLFYVCSSSSSNEEPIADQSYYNDEFRPQYHFPPDSMMMNDLNRMVYLDGKYHLFYQYFPDSTVWGPMYWCHAVSPDMTQWEHLPIALYPDELAYIFPESAAYDQEIAIGLGSLEKPPLIAVYTDHDMTAEKPGSSTVQTQGIASSIFKVRCWKKYGGNPVIANPTIRVCRDLKVSWRQEISHQYSQL